MKPIFLRGLVCSVLCGAVFLSGCATKQTTAETLMHDSELQRQQQLQQQAAERANSVPDNRNLYLTLIREMQSKGMYYASLAHVVAFEKKYGVQSDIELLRADALRETSQYDAALTVYQQLSETDTSGGAHHGLALAEAATGRYGSAIQEFNKAVALDPTNVTFLSDLGYAYILSGNLPAARLPLSQAAELGAGNRQVAANLVLYLIMTGDTTRADQLATRAKLSTETLQATHQLAIKLQRDASVAATDRESSMKLSSLSVNALQGQDKRVSSSSGVTSGDVSAPLSAANTLPLGTMLDRFGAAQ